MSRLKQFYIDNLWDKLAEYIAVITVSYLPNKCRNSYFLQNYNLHCCNKGLDYMATQLKIKEEKELIC